MSDAQTIRKVLVLYTGGTIGMKTSDRGYVCIAGYLPSVLKELPMFNDVEFDFKNEGVSLPVGKDYKGHIDATSNYSLMFTVPTHRSMTSQS